MVSGGLASASLGGDAVKRVLDVLVAAALLLVTLPLFAAVAVAIKVDSRGPVFFRCRRTGRLGREFAMLKFRKMVDGVEGLPLTMGQDARFTGVGRFLARSKLDELPQLWNVLRGEMSLVGPRPEDRRFVQIWRDTHPEILSVRPGITGLSQLAFAHESDLLDPTDPVQRLHRATASPEAVPRLTLRAKPDDEDGSEGACLDGLSCRVWFRCCGSHPKRPTQQAASAPAPAPAPAPVPDCAAGRHADEGGGMTDGIVDLAESLSARASRSNRPVSAVVLAGGRGTRLAPYTSVLPKPLMPIGESSILEIVLGQLNAHGITSVTLCVGYLSHLIRAVIGDRVADAVEISYVHEETALGTAGPLRLVGGLDSTFVVMNGDVLTTMDFNQLIRHHRREGNILTIATRERQIRIDYGVLDLGLNGSPDRVVAYTEKPEVRSSVSMGIYVLEPEALQFIPSEGSFDVPDLVQALLSAGEHVGAFRYEGLWFDIGRRDDYEAAAEAWAAVAEADDEIQALEVSAE